MVTLTFGNVPGLTGAEQERLNMLAEVYNYHQGKNAIKDKYYEGHVTLGDVNIGIALPQGLRNLEIGCSWGQKTVDVLAARSMFDGFVGAGGNGTQALGEIVEKNRLVAEYQKACRDQLKYGCVFATLSKSRELGCKLQPRPRPCGAGKGGESTAAWPLLTRPRTKNIRAHGTRRW